MCPKIRCDGESEKFCKIFWKLNWARVKMTKGAPQTASSLSHTRARQVHADFAAACLPCPVKRVVRLESLSTVSTAASARISSYGWRTVWLWRPRHLVPWLWLAGVRCGHACMPISSSPAREREWERHEALLRWILLVRVSVHGERWTTDAQHGSRWSPSRPYVCIRVSSTGADRSWRGRGGRPGTNIINRAVVQVSGHGNALCCLLLPIRVFVFVLLSPV
jgi:hypothetical protein